MSDLQLTQISWLERNFTIVQISYEMVSYWLVVICGGTALLLQFLWQWQEEMKPTSWSWSWHSLRPCPLWSATSIQWWKEMNPTRSWHNCLLRSRPLSASRIQEASTNSHHTWWRMPQPGSSWSNFLTPLPLLGAWTKVKTFAFLSNIAQQLQQLNELQHLCWRKWSRGLSLWKLKVSW